MKSYDHKKIEKKWQKNWQKENIYKTKDSSKKPKCYVLDMFPYPSGEGLHVGHPKGYIATDVYSRYKKMKGFNVLHPMGWDAFGLPAENYAIKNKIHPKVAVDKNIKTFKSQLDILGFNYDWEREINTTDPEYYKWTQWIFLEMFKKGLAYQSYEPINWCPSCKTGLANEDLDGDKCERCGSVVEKKPMRQWVLKITDYAERLLNDLDKLDWPESIKESQRNWIGKSEGAEIKFEIQNSKQEIKVFTTRPDTIFGATYLVLAPEHSWLEQEILNPKSEIGNRAEVKKYIEKSKKKTEIERTAEGKEKTGVELKGVKAINPANGEEISVWTADYVLAHYGTGAIMAVPAHDERDFEFAKKFDLSVMEVVESIPEDKKEQANSENVYTGKGVLKNSAEFDGLDSEEAKEKIIKFVGGKKKTTYKLKDWVFSRQRYWGEPIPLIFCEHCKKLGESSKRQETGSKQDSKISKGETVNPGWFAVPERDLPVELPKVKKYEPTGTGESPLADIKSWVNTKCPKCKGPAKRETNTMPQWAGSCWYYLRFMDPKNSRKPVDPKKESYWSPIDMYVGGAEHATRHLIYARFWHKFLYDLEVSEVSEPFKRLQHVGLIMAPDGKKMSKRYGNVINPDDMVEEWGADTLRVYEMFMGPFDQSIAWSTDNMVGSRRFLEKIWRLQEKVEKKDQARVSKEIESLIHKTIKKVGEDVESFGFNTAISALMILTNTLEKEKRINNRDFEVLLKLLTPFAPHITEEVWHNLGNQRSIYLSDWPDYDSQKTETEDFTIAVQVNGKVRDSVRISKNLEEAEIKEMVLSLDSVQKWVGGKELKKMIYVKNRLINIVVNP